MNKKILLAIVIALIVAAALAPTIQAFPIRFRIIYYTMIRPTTFDSPLRAFIIVDTDSGREYLVIPGAGIALLER